MDLVKQNSNMKQSMEAIADWERNQDGDLAEARVKVAKAKEDMDKINFKVRKLQAEVQRLTTEGEAKEMRMEVVKDAKAHVEAVNARVEAGRAREVTEGQQRRAETERLKALNKRLLSELEKQKAAEANIISMNAKLTKLEAERGLEKHKGEKANDVAKRMETMLVETQNLLAERDSRIKDLEHRNRRMSVQLPCDRGQECDYSCGREHHCGVPRVRSRAPRRRGSGSAPPPTVANLADEAGVQREDMEELVGEVQQQQQQQVRLPPHPRGQNQQQQRRPWKVIPCPDYHYNKVCARGSDCRNAHELVGAKEMARGRQRPSSLPPAQMPSAQMPPGPATRAPSQGRGGGKKKFTVPDYNPEHPHYGMWSQRVRESSQARLTNRPAGNANGQVNMTGAAPVHTQPQIQPLPLLQPRPQPQPQTQHQQSQPQGQRVRSYSEAASDPAQNSSVTARQTVADAMRQQASARAHLEAMEDPRWRAALEAARGAIGPQSSQGSQNSAAKSSSVGDLRRSGQ